MNEDLDEEKDGSFEKNDEITEEFDKKFEPLDEICDKEAFFDVFEPEDEFYNNDRIFINEFEPCIDNNEINHNREPKHNLQPRKIDPKTPSKHKIKPRKINPSKGPRHKLQPRIIHPKTPPKHKIESRKINSEKEPIHKIQSQRVSHENTKQIPSKQHSSIVKPNITSPNKKNSLINEKQKECRRCNQVKNINEFEIYQNKIERYCKPCRLEYKQVRAMGNKAKIMRNMYGGKFGEKCPECHTTIANLPAFDFHHPIKELKSKPINFHGNWEKVLNRLESEKVLPTCRNCHLKKQSKFYTKYKKLIERKNNIESLKGIEEKLYKQIYKEYPGIGHKEGHQIKSWMSKKIVIERLYKGGCIGCDETNLTTLQFHHRDKEKKTFKKYDKLRYTTLENIEKKLIQDDAVCLCGNCHRMVTSKYYEKNHQEIVGSKYSQEIVKNYKFLNENIKNHKFPTNILNQYPNIKTEKILIGVRKRMSYKLKSNENRIKSEIMKFDWQKVSKNWRLPSGELLDPTRESSRTNPLYKHKDWLSTVYNKKDWGLSDTKIARITNSSNTNINYWRNKFKIPVKKENIGKNA